MIFIERTSKRLIIDKTISDLENQIRGLAALILSKKEIESETRDRIYEILSCTWNSKKSEEILLFRNNRTILRPSLKWIDDLAITVKNKLAPYKDLTTGYILEKAKERIEKSFDCMYDNYCSFLSVTFAANKFLEGCIIPRKDSIPRTKMDGYAKTFSKVFGNQKTTGRVFHYYPHALEQIGKSINLQDRIQEITFK